MNWLPPLFEESVEQKNKREMLLGLNSRRGRREIFQGAPSDAVVAKRRAKNKAARKARRASRG